MSPVRKREAGGGVQAGLVTGIAVFCLGLAAVVFVAAGGGDGHSALRPTAASGLGPGQLAGQRVIAGLRGSRVPGRLVRAIRTGRVGGVILFRGFFTDRDRARRSIRRLQAVGRPPRLRPYPLLVMTDQEGGLVKRLGGAPLASAAEIGKRGPAYARRQGVLTGRNLRNVGVNMDLAPVHDVARPGGDIFETYRAFGTTARRVVATGVPFAEGIQAAGVAATAKHFPGIGTIAVNTDFAIQRVLLGRAALRKVDEVPFGAFARARGDAVMVGNAIYPAFGSRPAAFNGRIVKGELRQRLGFRGVTITDALGAVAARAFGGPRKAAVAAAAAGMDLMLWGDPDSPLASQVALRNAFRSGRLDRTGFRKSVDRVLALRARVGR